MWFYNPKDFLAPLVLQLRIPLEQKALDQQVENRGLAVLTLGTIRNRVPQIQIQTGTLHGRLLAHSTEKKKCLVAIGDEAMGDCN